MTDRSARPDRTPRRFAFAFAPAYRVAGLPFGVTPWTTGVEVADDELRVRFGPWRLRTPLANVTTTQVTDDFSFVKTAGPPHLSFTDHGVSFATNAGPALCVQFAERVKGIDPTGRILHPGATLTVADPAALAEALGRPVTG